MSPYPIASNPIAPLGVLILHGFTSSIKAVDGIVPYLKKAKLPYRLPILRGHGKTPKALVGVSWREWVADAEDALEELLSECDRVVIVSLSMGALVALELGIRHAERIAGVVTVAPALRFANPLAALAPWLRHVIPYFPAPTSFTDKAAAKAGDNYSKFPVTAFASLYEFSHRVEAALPRFACPLLILQHRKVQVTHPKGARILYSKVNSAQKKLLWFSRSGHDMMQDCEKEAVFKAIMKFIDAAEAETRG